MNFKDHTAMRPYMGLLAPIWVFDVTAHAIWWANAPALEFWQAESLAELRGRDFSSDSTSVRDRLSSILAQTKFSTPTLETWTLYPKDAPKRVLVSIQRVQIEAGQPAILVEVVRSAPSEEDLEATRIVEASRSADFLLSTFDLEGRLLAQNPAAAITYGHTTETLDETRLADRLGDAQLAQHLLARVRDREKLTWEAIVPTQKGTRRHLISAREGRDPITGAFVAVISELDVTEFAALRLYQEERNAALSQEVLDRTKELERSQRRYEIALATAAIWDWDLISGEFFLSDKFHKRIGLSEEAFWANSHGAGLARLVSFVHQSDRTRVLDAIAAHIEDAAHSLLVEFRVPTASDPAASDPAASGPALPDRAAPDDVVWFRAQGHCLFDQDLSATRSVGTLTDVTEQKRIEASVLGSQRLEAVGQLTGGIAHDFNNLLTVIHGNAELLLELEEFNPIFVQDIVQAARRGADLTSQLLAFARKQSLTPQVIDLYDLLLRLRSTLLRTLGGSLNIHVSVPKSTWQIRVDPTQFQNALLNIAINARDAMSGTGEIRISCKNVLCASKDGDSAQGSAQSPFVQIQMSDTGSGMTDETVMKAFEPFFTTKDVGKGSGLGLSMVMGFARQSGGDCEIQTKLGHGTTVVLTLPADPAPLRAQDPIADDLAPQGRGQHVHVVDDDAPVRASVVQLIEALGYRVTWSADAQSALTQAELGLQPDLFLIDFALPSGMSGLELSQELHRLQPAARRLLMSGHRDIPAGHAAPDGVELLPKPFTKAVLSRVLSKHLSHPKRSTADPFA